MSEVLKVVFVAFTQHCIQSTVTGQSEEAALLSFLDLSTTRVIAGKMHSQSPILKLKGAQQPGNSYISMGTKLHPPYPN